MYFYLTSLFLHCRPPTLTFVIIIIININRILILRVDVSVVCEKWRTLSGMLSCDGEFVGLVNEIWNGLFFRMWNKCWKFLYKKKTNIQWETNKCFFQFLFVFYVFDNVHFHRILCRLEIFDNFSLRVDWEIPTFHSLNSHVVEPEVWQPAIYLIVKHTHTHTLSLSQSITKNSKNEVWVHTKGMELSSAIIFNWVWKNSSRKSSNSCCLISLFAAFIKRTE